MIYMTKHITVVSYIATHYDVFLLCFNTERCSVFTLKNIGLGTNLSEVVPYDMQTICFH